MTTEDTSKSGPVGTKSDRKAQSYRVKSTSHQPTTHTAVHRGTSPHKSPLVAEILTALDDKRRQALELHHESTDPDRSLAAGVYSEAMNDAIEIVKHQAHRLASKASL